MRIYLPSRFVPAPGIPMESYFSWMKEGCTFDTDGFVRSKKGIELGEWWKRCLTTESSYYNDMFAPAKMWHDLNRLEKQLIDINLDIDARMQEVAAIATKYKKKLKKLKLSEARFCCQFDESMKSKYEWLGIVISNNGYSIDKTHQVDFQVTPDKMRKLDILGDRDLFILAESNTVIYKERSIHQSILREVLCDRYLKNRETSQGSIVTITTQNFSFVFTCEPEYDYGPRTEMIWKYVLGPVPNKDFKTLNVDGKEEILCA